MSLHGTPTILLTGFAPFGGETVNPSWQAVAALDAEFIQNHRVIARQLPVEFGGALSALHDALRETRPVLVLGVGQAGGRAQLSIERIAINIDDARIPDNAGACPIDIPVVCDGPAAYFSSLPIKAILAELRAAGIPAEISQTAGTYVCNHAFYGLMHALHGGPGIRGGFIHIPYAPEQAVMHPGAPCMAIETVTAALRIALKTAISTTHDRHLGAGSEH